MSFEAAIQIAADVMRMSTMFYGNEFDLEAFKAMLNQTNLSNSC